jgi:hypothetical protein
MAASKKPKPAETDEVEVETTTTTDDDGLHAQLVDHMAYGNPYVPPQEQPAED